MGPSHSLVRPYYACESRIRYVSFSGGAILRNLYARVRGAGSTHASEEQMATLGNVERALMEPGGWVTHPQSIGQLMVPRVTG